MKECALKNTAMTSKLLRPQNYVIKYLCSLIGLQLQEPFLSLSWAGPNVGGLKDA